MSPDPNEADVSKSATPGSPEDVVNRFLRLATHQVQSVAELEQTLSDLRYTGGTIHFLGRALDHVDLRARMLAGNKLIEINAVHPKILDSALVKRAETTIIHAIRSADHEDQAWGCSLFKSGPVPEPICDLLRELLTSVDLRVRTIAAAALVNGNEPDDTVVEILADAAGSGEPVLISTAAVAASRLGIPTPSLLPVLSKHDNLDFCDFRSILECIAEIGTATHEDMEILAILVEDPHVHTTLRSGAAVALGSVTKGTETAMSVLCRALASTEIELVLGAVSGIEKAGCDPAEAVDVLISRLSEDDEKIRIAATRGLVTLKPPAASIPRLLSHARRESNPIVQESLADVLVAAGGAALPFAIDIVRSRDYQLAPLASMVIALSGEMGAKAVADALLNETEEYGLAMLISCVSVLGSSAALVVPSLTILLGKTANDEVVVHVAKALSSLGPIAAPASVALVRSLISRSEHVRAVAEIAIKSIGRDAVPALDDSLKNAPADHKKRIESLTREILVGTDGRFSKFESFGDDRTLEMFVQIADFMTQHGVTSLGKMSRAFEQQRERSDVDFSVSASALRKGIKALESFLGCLLIDRTMGRKGPLTPEAKKVLPEVKEYLITKRRRRETQSRA